MTSDSKSGGGEYRYCFEWLFLVLSCVVKLKEGIFNTNMVSLCLFALRLRLKLKVFFKGCYKRRSWDFSV